MAGLKFYNNAQTFSTTLNVPEPTSNTTVTMPTSGTVLSDVLSASSTPVANSSIVFQLTSNTSLTIKVKGTDGVVRSVSLTLA